PGAFSAIRWCRQHGAEPEKDEATFREGREMGIGETGRAPGDQRCRGELPVRCWRLARQGAKDEEQKCRQADQPLLAEDLEELIVRIRRLASLPASHTLSIRSIAILEAAGADAEQRMIAGHAKRRGPKDGAVSERGRLR